MSFATLKRAIIEGARFVVRNPRLKLEDICEWSTDEKTVKDNCDPKHEVYFHVPDPGVWVCIQKIHDKPASAFSSSGLASWAAFTSSQNELPRIEGVFEFLSLHQQVRQHPELFGKAQGAPACYPLRSKGTVGRAIFSRPSRWLFSELIP